MAGKPAGVGSGQGGRAAGKVFAVPGLKRQRGERDWRGADDDERGSAGKREVRRRTSRAAELQAQVALRLVMLKVAILEAVHDVRRGRKEQRDQCEEDNQPWMAGTHETGVVRAVRRFDDVAAAYPLAAMPATQR